MGKLKILKTSAQCQFCGFSENDYLKYGPLYKLQKITAHYYCVLLSNNLTQNGKDSEGILGFLLSDIKKELQRASHIQCTYCKKGRATISCATSKCKRTFHLPCALKEGSSHHFIDSFKSYCPKHRHTQNIPLKIIKEALQGEVICCICQENVDVEAKNMDALWAPCCIKTWYHRNCVQELAYSAGYFCRCPACNDSNKFNNWIKKYGIFIPQQDASWELIPNAFEELLYRYNSCDAEECKCPGGRQSNIENTMWEIILCESCGSQGVHVACGGLKFVDPEWECSSCCQVTKSAKSSVTDVSVSCKADMGQKRKRRNSEDLKHSSLDNRKKCRTSPQDEEIEIDVETMDDEASAGGREKSRESGKGGHLLAEEVRTALRNDPQEVLSLLKPGPLSYKLSAIRNLVVNLPVKDSEKQYGRNSAVIDVIELSDSEEESVVKVIKEENEGISEERSKSVVDCNEKKDCADGRESRSRLQAEVVTEREQQEWKKETVSPSTEVTNQLKAYTFSWADFEVVAIVTLQSVVKAEDGRTPTNELFGKAACLNQPNNFPESVATNRQQTAGREDKELMQTLDDDVIILTD